jgi:transcriptional regulator with XRE-family HTH domain
MPAADDEDLAADFGAALRERRTELDLSQAEVAERAGLQRAALARLERGERAPGLRSLWRVAHAVDLRPSELIRAAEQRREQR